MSESATRSNAPKPRMTRTAAEDPLAPLHEDMLREIAASGVLRKFAANTILINEGDQGDSLFILVSGKVKVFASNEAGKEVVIAFVGPGEYVGEMSLDGSPRSASVMTTEPTTCAVVTRVQFVEFTRTHPEFAMHVIEKLIRRCRATTENMKSLALSDVYGRLVRLLNALAVTVEGRTVVNERLTQQEIAERSGASRDMVSRQMKDLVAGGYLASEERTLVILRKLPPAW